MKSLTQNTGFINNREVMDFTIDFGLAPIYMVLFFEENFKDIVCTLHTSNKKGFIVMIRGLYVFLPQVSTLCNVDLIINSRVLCIILVKPDLKT